MEHKCDLYSDKSNLLHFLAEVFTKKMPLQHWRKGEHVCYSELFKSLDPDTRGRQNWSLAIPMNSTY